MLRTSKGRFAFGNKVVLPRDRKGRFKKLASLDLEGSTPVVYQEDRDAVIREVDAYLKKRGGE